MNEQEECNGTCKLSQSSDLKNRCWAQQRDWYLESSWCWQTVWGEGWWFAKKLTYPPLSMLFLSLGKSWGMASNADIMVEVCYRLPSQDEEVGKMFYKQLGEVSWLFLWGNSTSQMSAGNAVQQRGDSVGNSWSVRRMTFWRRWWVSQLGKVPHTPCCLQTGKDLSVVWWLEALLGSVITKF